MSATTPPQRAALAFADARSCKEWLNALPLTNIPQAQTLVLESLRTLSESEFDPLDRLKCLELMRDKIAFLQGEQRSRYFGKSLPLSVNDNNAWNTGRSLLEEMETGYRACLAQARGGEGELAPHAALIAQRIMRYLGAQMLFHAIVYRRFDPQLWVRLHKQFAEAEREGLLEERIKDSLESEDSGSSVMEAYVQIVLIQAAYLSELTAPQMDFVEALLRMWIRKVQVRRESADGAPAPAIYPLGVDLDKPIGARPLIAADMKPNHRILDIEQLSLSMRKRIHGLKKDEDPVSLGLPGEASAQDALRHLTRLHRLWCEGAPVRPPAKVPAEQTAGLTFGLGEIHFFVTGGKVFEQPDKSRELTRQERQDIEVFGKIRETTQTKMVSEFNFIVESWGVIDEMLGAWRLQRPSTASKTAAIGRLVGMRLGDTAPFYLGVTSALSQETDGRIVITVTLFPGRPEPVAARASDARNRPNSKWTEAFRLPALEKMKIPASLVVGNGVAQRGRGVDVWEEGAKEHTVYDLLDRGTDFDRFSF
jgi:cyclic-di-GMP-binding protein